MGYISHWWWNSKIHDWMIEKLDCCKPISHPTIFIPKGCFYVDKLVLPDLQQLWNADISTFFSCQGGPVSQCKRDGEFDFQRAYVSVRREDAFMVCYILRDRNPIVDDVTARLLEEDRSNDWRTAVRFDPCQEAMDYRPNS